MKPCKECGQTKDLSAFHRRKSSKDGRYNTCKVCTKKYSARYYQENKEAKAGYNAKYRQENKEALSKYRARYYQENKEAISEYQGRYGQENKEAIAKNNSKRYQENKDKIREHVRQYVKDNPIKKRAQLAVYTEVRRGSLIAPGYCEECYTQCKPDAHHNDYALPLVVRWLCRSCHRAWHKEHGPGLNG